jgi:hypothetical protein
LLHDKLNVFGLEPRVIDLLAIIFIFVLLVLNRLALAMVMVVVVVVAGMVVGLGFGLSELLGGGCLGLRVQVLNLGLTEDAGL